MQSSLPVMPRPGLQVSRNQIKEEPGMNKDAAPLKIFTLSIVVPCFNEEKLLCTCIERVMGIKDKSLNLQVIIVNDGSNDNSLSVALELKGRYPEITVLNHLRNRGKGAAVRTGLTIACGEFIAVQDADLEYDPKELKRLLLPLISGEADIVLGSRFLSRPGGRVLSFWHTLGNRILTLVSNIFTDLNLTDMGTCYKVFRKSVVDKIELSENRFGFDAEIIAKTAHHKEKFFELGISYSPRGYEQGKKIRIRDGISLVTGMVRHSSETAPSPVRLGLYTVAWVLLMLCNLSCFKLFTLTGASIPASAAVAFSLTTILNHLLFCRVPAGSRTGGNILYFLVLVLLCLLDMECTLFLGREGFTLYTSKLFPALLVQFISFRATPLLLCPGKRKSPSDFPVKKRSARHRQIASDPAHR